jgi:hypothetical protein
MWRKAGGGATAGQRGCGRGVCSARAVAGDWIARVMDFE